MQTRLAYLINMCTYNMYNVQCTLYILHCTPVIHVHRLYMYIVHTVTYYVIHIYNCITIEYRPFTKWYYICTIYVDYGTMYYIM